MEGNFGHWFRDNAFPIRNRRMLPTRERWRRGTCDFDQHTPMNTPPTTPPPSWLRKPLDGYQWKYIPSSNHSSVNLATDWYEVQIQPHAPAPADDSKARAFFEDVRKLHSPDSAPIETPSENGPMTAEELGFDSPALAYRSVTDLACMYPNLAEYLAQKERECADLLAQNAELARGR